jgi:hypothetical protein
MNSDETIADLARRSVIGRTGEQTLTRLRGDARASAIGRGFRSVYGQISRLTTGERLRLLGVTIVTAIATNAVLLQWSPPVTRPAPPSMLSVVTTASGLALIILAEPLARAWQQSWIRHQWIRARGSNAADSGRA